MKSLVITIPIPEDGGLKTSLHLISRRLLSKRSEIAELVYENQIPAYVFNDVEADFSFDIVDESLEIPTFEVMG